MQTSVHQNVHVEPEDAVAVQVRNFDMGSSPNFVSVDIEIGTHSFSFFIAPEKVCEWERKMQILADDLFALGCELNNEWSE